MQPRHERDIALAFTGASGAQYGLRLLECLLAAGCRVQLVISRPAQIVLATEADFKLPAQSGAQQAALEARFGARPGQLRVYGQDQWTAPLASGSAFPEALVICPCSMATLAAVAAGASRSLIERAADVALKEGRRLILVPRETPFSAIHLENMLKLARLGVVLLPANPGFYHRPDSVAALVDFVVARVLDQLAIPHDLAPRWGEAEES